MAKTVTWESHWENVRLRHKKIQDEGRVSVTRAGTKLHVVCPYHPDFPLHAREKCKGRYRERTRMWVFPITHTLEVLNAIQSVYGTSKLTPAWEQERVRLMQRFLRGGE